MGAAAQYYCDGCGDPIGLGTFDQCITINAMGSSATVTQIMLCLKQEPSERPKESLPGGGSYDPNVYPYKRNNGKINGCARKVLTKTLLARLYEDVAAVTGDPEIKPFPL